MREFPQLSGEILFFTALKDLSLCLGPMGEFSTILGKNLFILLLTGDLVNNLDSLKSFLSDFQSTKGCSRSFQSTRDALRVPVSSTLLKVFLSFWMLS